MWLRALLVCLLAFGAVTTSSAAPAGKRPGKPTAQQQRALALFEQSVAAYRAGRFREAVELLERAYELEPEPVLLYNLGRACEGMGDLDRAIESYRAYLAGDPEAPDRLAIEARIATLTEVVEERRRLERERRAALARAEEQARQRRDDERRRRQSISTAPWIIAGAGVAGIGTGVGLGVAALGRRSGAEDAATQEQAAAQLDRARQLALGANVAFAIGGALAVGGTIWGVLDWRRARRAREIERPVVMVPTGTGAAVIVAF